MARQPNDVLLLCQKRSFVMTTVCAVLMTLVCVNLLNVFSAETRENLIPWYYWLAKYFTLADIFLAWAAASFLYFGPPSDKLSAMRGAQFGSSILLLVCCLLGFLLCLVAAALGAVVFGFYIPVVFKYVNSTCGDGALGFREHAAYCSSVPHSHPCKTDFNKAHQMLSNFLKTFSVKKALTLPSLSCITEEDWNANLDFADQGKKNAMIAVIGCGVSALLFNYCVVYALEQVNQLRKSSKEQELENEQVQDTSFIPAIVGQA